MNCSFCGRINDDDVAYLVAGPDDNNICDECLLKIAAGILAKDSLLREPVTCSFCGIQDKKPHGIGIEGKVAICSLCTLKALQIIRHHNKPCHDKAVKLGDRINSPGYYSAN